jgi:hypothetical protein
MRRVCPVELKFETALERAKESLRKSRQKHNEDLEDQRQEASQLPLSNFR